MRTVSLCLALVATAACGGGANRYRVPADSPMKTFIAPDPDDLVDEDAVAEQPSEPAAPAAAEVAPAAPTPPPPAAKPAR